MDVEILFQMVRKGMIPYYLQGYYRHMDHERGNATHQEKFGDSHRNLNGYVNRETWGFTNAKSEVKDGITFLST